MGKQAWPVRRVPTSRPFLQGVALPHTKVPIQVSARLGFVDVRIHFMLWSTDIPDMVLFVPASVIPHIALPNFGRMKATILLKHHSTSVLSSASQRRVLGMLSAWVRTRLIELRSSICNPDLRKCLCLPGHYTLHLSVISSLLQLTSEVLHQPNLSGFILCIYFFFVILANKCIYHTLTSLSI